MLIKIPKKVVNDYIDIQIQSNSLYHWVVDECGSIKDWLWSKGLNLNIQRAVIANVFKKLNDANIIYNDPDDHTEDCFSIY